MFYDPFTEFNRFFGDAFVGRFQFTVVPTGVCYNLNQNQNPFCQRMDLFEAKENSVVTAILELPGLTSEDVTIDVQERRLIIFGDAPLPKMKLVM